MFTGPVGPVEVFFWNFYLPGAIGPLLASSPATSPTSHNTGVI